jgi:hypothetical protein
LNSKADVQLLIIFTEQEGNKDKKLHHTSWKLHRNASKPRQQTTPALSKAKPKEENEMRDTS